MGRDLFYIDLRIFYEGVQRNKFPSLKSGLVAIRACEFSARMVWIFSSPFHPSCTSATQPFVPRRNLLKASSVVETLRTHVLKKLIMRWFISPVSVLFRNTQAPFIYSKCARRLGLAHYGNTSGKPIQPTLAPLPPGPQASCKWVMRHPQNFHPSWDGSFQIPLCTFKH